MLGGRTSPARPLNDCWLLDTAAPGGPAGALHWQQLQAQVQGPGGCEGEWPGRFRHSAAHVASAQVRVLLQRCGICRPVGRGSHDVVHIS
jgi:hypothetical protein